MRILLREFFCVDSSVHEIAGNLDDVTDGELAAFAELDGLNDEEIENYDIGEEERVPAFEKQDIDDDDVEHGTFFGIH